VRTLEFRVRKEARDSGVGQAAVERDDAQSHVLLGIESRPRLRESLVF